MDAIIRLQRVVKGYGVGFGTQLGLDDFHLDVEPGAFVAVTGPSGCGKTTLLNLIGGLDRPDNGSVSVGGTQLEALSPSGLTRWRAGHIGFVFQSHYLSADADGRRQRRAALDAHAPVSGGAASTRGGRLVARGLADRAGHRPAQPSERRQQRVGIARAIVAGASVLCCATSRRRVSIATPRMPCSACCGI